MAPVAYTDCIGIEAYHHAVFFLNLYLGRCFKNREACCSKHTVGSFIIH